MLRDKIGCLTIQMADGRQLMMHPDETDYITKEWMKYIRLGRNPFVRWFSIFTGYNTVIKVRDLYSCNTWIDMYCIISLHHITTNALTLHTDEIDEMNEIMKNKQKINDLLRD